MPATKTKVHDEFGEYRFDQTTILTDNGYNQHYDLQQAEGYTQSGHVNQKNDKHFVTQYGTETPLYEASGVTRTRYDVEDDKVFVNQVTHYQDADGKRETEHYKYSYDWDF